ncbi:MAG: hypothetical protein ACYT04_96940 [Nostoc sp.]
MKNFSRAPLQIINPGVYLQLADDCDRFSPLKNSAHSSETSNAR